LEEYLLDLVFHHDWWQNDRFEDSQHPCFWSCYLSWSSWTPPNCKDDTKALDLRTIITQAMEPHWYVGMDWRRGETRTAACCHWPLHDAPHFYTYHYSRPAPFHPSNGIDWQSNAQCSSFGVDWHLFIGYTSFCQLHWKGVWNWFLQLKLWLFWRGKRGS